MCHVLHKHQDLEVAAEPGLDSRHYNLAGSPSRPHKRTRSPEPAAVGFSTAAVHSWADPLTPKELLVQFAPDNLSQMPKHWERRSLHTQRCQIRFRLVSWRACQMASH